MVVDYFRERFAEGRFGKHIKPSTLDEIIDMVHCKSRTGTELDANYGNILSERFAPLQFTFVEGGFELEDIEENLVAGIPVIVIFDAVMLENPNQQFEGFAHASVAIGLDDRSIILHDPQVAAFVAVPLDRFMPAWEITKNWVITFNIAPTVQTRVDDEESYKKGTEKGMEEERKS